MLKIDRPEARNAMSAEGVQELNDMSVQLDVELWVSRSKD